jgi:hypothetical protein
MQKAFGFLYPGFFSPLAVQMGRDGDFEWMCRSIPAAYIVL